MTTDSDFDARVTFLKEKAHAEGVSLPADVAAYLATRITSGNGDLEGHLLRLIAHASLTGRALTQGLAERMVRQTETR